MLSMKTVSKPDDTEPSLIYANLSVFKPTGMTCSKERQSVIPESITINCSFRYTYKWSKPASVESL